MARREKCDLCGKDFKNKAGLGGHRAFMHGLRKTHEPRLKDVFRDSMAMMEHRLSVCEGRIAAIDRARLQYPLGEGTPNIADLTRALIVYLRQPSSGMVDCGKANLCRELREVIQS